MIVDDTVTASYNERRILITSIRNSKLIVIFNMECMSSLQTGKINLAVHSQWEISRNYLIGLSRIIIRN